jgi:hypothetical protein
MTNAVDLSSRTVMIDENKNPCYENLERLATDLVDFCLSEGYSDNVTLLYNRALMDFPAAVELDPAYWCGNADFSPLRFAFARALIALDQLNRNQRVTAMRRLAIVVCLIIVKTGALTNEGFVAGIGTVLGEIAQDLDMFTKDGRVFAV